MKAQGECFQWLCRAGIGAVICVVLLPIIQGRAQGTLEFTAHLSEPVGTYFGDGVFTLSSNYFHYELTTSYGFFDGQIRTPSADTNSISVLALALFAAHPPAPLPSTDPGYCLFLGHAVLTDAQIAQLENGEWYAYSSANPPFYLSGQIVPVPEPGSASLAVVAIAMLAFSWRTIGVWRNRESRSGLMNMRKFLVILCVTLSAAAAFGQGTVNFVNNTLEFGNSSKLLHWADGTQPGVVLNSGLTGFPAASVGLVSGEFVTSNLYPSLRAQLYWGASTATSFSQLTALTGPTATFRSTTSLNAGAWNGGQRTVDSWVGDTHQQLAVIVWDSNKASDGLVALAGLAQGTYSGLYGQSALFDYLVPGVLIPPDAELMVNMVAFNVAYYDTIPEPNAFALIVFGSVVIARVSKSKK